MNDLIQDAKDLRNAAIAAGEQLSFAEALAAAQAKGSRPVTADKDRDKIEASLPTFDGKGTENVLDFLFQLNTKFDRKAITDDKVKREVLVSRLRGRALQWYRNAGAQVNRYATLLDRFQAEFSVTPEHLRCTLQRLSFLPGQETVRKFNNRFNDVLDGAANVLADKEVVDLYLAAIARGDSSLAQGVILSHKDLTTAKVGEIQRYIQVRLDHYAAITQAAGNDGQGGQAYQQAAKALETGPGASVESVKAKLGLGDQMISEIVRQLANGNGNGNGTGSVSGSVAAKPTIPGRAQSVTSQPVQRGPGQPRLCFKCGSAEHLAAQCPTVLDPKNKKETVTRAVGMILDMYDQDRTSVPVVQQTLVAPMFVNRAVGAIADATAAGNPAPMVEFARALLAYSTENPADTQTAGYLQKFMEKGEQALEQIISAQPAYASKVIAAADTRVRKSTGTQAGNRGVAQELYPGVTDYLSSLPSKATLADQMRSSEELTRSMLELCLEIALDKRWQIDLERTRAELLQAMTRRTYGEYAADQRTRERLHMAEQMRLHQWKPQQQQQEQQMEEIPQPGAWLQGTTFAFKGNEATVNAATVRAEQEIGMKHDVDLASLYGPPTGHETMHVLLRNQGGQTVRVKAIRDTGAPDTCISKRLALILGMKIDPTDDTFGVVGRSEQTKFVGVVRDVPVQLAPRLVVPVTMYVTPDDNVLLLLANDLFNADKAKVVGVVAAESYYVVQFGTAVDIVPFEKLTPDQRKQHSVAHDAAQRSLALGATSATPEQSKQSQLRSNAPIAYYPTLEQYVQEKIVGLQLESIPEVAGPVASNQFYLQSVQCVQQNSESVSDLGLKALVEAAFLGE